MLGIAVATNVATTGHVYLYYTHRSANGCTNASTNQVSRFTLAGDLLTDEVVLIDGIRSFAGNHNGGDLAFGADGMLYVSVGDGGCDYRTGNCGAGNAAARARNHLLGKVLRIAPDGSVPPDSPFAGSPSCSRGPIAAGQTCAEIYATGLRNPFRFAFDPDTPGSFVINDVGQDVWEEIDIGAAGATRSCPARCGRFARSPGTGGRLPHSRSAPTMDCRRSR